jgi:hypothetical protein
MKWLTYSGASIILTVNPVHWRWVPQAGRDFSAEWPGSNQRTGYASWLFLTVRVWVDDGSW